MKKVRKKLRKKERKKVKERKRKLRKNQLLCKSNWKEFSHKNLVKWIKTEKLK